MSILHVHTVYNGNFINSRTIHVPLKTRKDILNRFVRDGMGGKVWNHTITNNPVGTVEVAYVDGNTIEVRISDPIEDNGGIFQRAMDQFQELFVNNS